MRNLDQLARFAREAQEARAAESGLRDLYESACRRAWEAEGYRWAWHELLEWAEDPDRYDMRPEDLLDKMAELEEELSTR